MKSYQQTFQHFTTLGGGGYPRPGKISKNSINILGYFSGVNCIYTSEIPKIYITNSQTFSINT